MKVKVNQRKLEFIEYNNAELKWLEKNLIWETKDKDGNITSSSILWTEQDKLCSYAGTYKLLNQYFPKHFKLEVFNMPEIEIIDYNIPKDLLNDIILEDFQVAAIKKCLINKLGLVISSTGSGKTIIMCALLRFMIDNKLINSGVVIVPSILAAEQFVKKAFKYGFDQSEIAVCHSKSPNAKRFKVEGVNTNILVIVSNSASNSIKNNDMIKEKIECSDIVLFDEAQHNKSDININVLDFLDCVCCEHVLGFTGSAFTELEILKSYSDTLLFVRMSGIVYMITYQYLESIGLLSHMVAYFKPVYSGQIKNYKAHFNTIHDRHIVDNKIRNEIAVFYAKFFVQYGYTVLISVLRLDHARKVMTQLIGYNVLCIFGDNIGLKFRDNKIVEFEIDYNKAAEQIENGEWDIIIGSPVLDEVFDAPSINALIPLSGGKSRIKLKQRKGRASRRKENNISFVLDFQDYTHVFLKSHSDKRRIIYNMDGVEIIDDENKFMDMVIESGEICPPF
jgi:superfamily II DNA or RNA helicase